MFTSEVSHFITSTHTHTLCVMENSSKLESMPTLRRSTTLPAETTISKWRVTATIRLLLQLPSGGTSAFGDLRGRRSLLEIVFVGQCEVFVCIGFGHFFFFFSLAAKLIGPRMGC